MRVDLNARARKILYAVVTEFIATGEPVGSRTLAKKFELDLSPASIRNVLADLEEAGFLRQPHASAGRVPTERAFRVFIDALMQLRELTTEQRSSIELRYHDLEPGSNVLRETARMLSGLTGTAAVVVASRPDAHSLKQLRFIATRPGELLAVIVTAGGNVENRFLRVEGSPSNEELQRIHNLLDDVIEGRTLQDVRELFARRLHDAQTELGALRRRAFELAAAALAKSSLAAVEVVIEGQAQLLDKPEFADVDRIKQLVRVLEEREHLIAILDRTIETGGVQITLPDEGDEEGLGADLSLVAAPYGLDPGLGRGAAATLAGTVGVIGPTRMDYASIVPIVNETARAVGAYLGRRDRREPDDER
jgi:heat-inducible transcriptional repressor